jgi:indole-3-glycerol phosphate synthase
MTWRPPKGVLAQLVDGAREDLAERKRHRPTISPAAADQRGRRGFMAALIGSADGLSSTALGVSGVDAPVMSTEPRRRFAFICEVKRASPSAGAISLPASAVDVAKAYVEGGARCISVLTEGRRFGGSLDDLRQVRAAVGVPLLRKDFIVDPYMVAEAAEAGADCVLLIAGAVEPKHLGELSSFATELGMDVLLELVHERELEVLDAVRTPLVGINARDLETLEVDPMRFGRLAPLVPKDRFLVAESGIKGPEDVQRVQRQGARAALVGESLMRAPDPRAAVRALVEAG